MKRYLPLMMAAALALVGCGGAEFDEVPELAEVEIDPTSNDVEFHDVTELGAGDVGKRIMAAGRVVGTPIDAGFFLRTEHDQVIFVVTDSTIAMNRVVRATGPMAAADSVAFSGWETAAFPPDWETDWQVVRSIYMEAGTVVDMGEAGSLEAGG